MKYSLLFIFLMLRPLSFFNQQAELSNTIKNVNQLHFMIGTWKGNGWIMTSDRQVKKFTQTEKINSKAGDSILLIDGLGYEIDSTGNTNRIIHEALGIISYNPQKERVTMISFSKLGGRMESDIQLVGEKKINWSFINKKSKRTIRFSEDFSTDGKWKEVGEISSDGVKWFKFFEMNLVHVESN